LFTPVNSIDVLSNKRLVVLIQGIEGKNVSRENFAYAVVRFDAFKQEGDKWRGVVKGDLIGYNARLGTFECAVVFDVVDPANNDHLDQSSSSEGEEKAEVEKVEAKKEVPEIPPKE
jgi:hypothetical protein